MDLEPEELEALRADLKKQVKNGIFDEADIPAIIEDYKRFKLSDEEMAEIAANAVDEVPLPRPLLFNRLT